MNNEISWQVELAVKPGELNRFRALTREMVESAKDEPGVLIYERFVSGDGATVWVYERYADAAAAVAHVTTFARLYAERLTTLIERRRFVVFGTPSEALRSLLDRFGATYVSELDGFSLANPDRGAGGR